MMALLRCGSKESSLQELPRVASVQGKLEQENLRRLAGDVCPHGLACGRPLHGCFSCPTNMTNASFPLVTETHHHCAQDDTQKVIMLMAWEVSMCLKCLSSSFL